MEGFYRTHNYLVEHNSATVRRQLMDEIDWSHRLIGIKGSRGVGKTTFLLQYAKEKFGKSRACLYVNMNNLYFSNNTLVDFAEKFHKQGGEVLLIDQVFKYDGWSKELKTCYEKFPKLKIVFTGSSVMRLKEENVELRDIAESYNLRGFSLREFINIKEGVKLKSYSLNEIMSNHSVIAKAVLSKTDPMKYIQEYIHHGYYPFFLEKRNFSENLLKTMNMMLEVDILLLKEIELKYLSKIKKLLYLLAINRDKAPNISSLAKEINTSRATIMNYINYLSDARLINLIYKQDEDDKTKKPSKIVMHNSNLLYSIYPLNVNEEEKYETFFINTLWKDHEVNITSSSSKNITYKVDNEHEFRVCKSSDKMKKNDNVYYALSDLAKGKDNKIPLWIFGFLY